MNQPAFLSEQYVEQAIKRWEPLLEGVSGDYDRAMTATLLDNQKVWNENATDSTAPEVFTTFSFPMIRRIYPELMANQLVSVQPMRQPTGKIFFLDFIYGSNQAPISAGSRNDYEVDQGATILNAEHYSHGYVRGATIGAGDASTVEFQLPAPASSPYLDSTFTPVRDNSNLMVYVDSTPQTMVTNTTPSAGQVNVDTQTGTVTFGTAPAGGTTITADYDLRLEGDDSRIPELQLEMSSDSVSAETRKLKVRWTIEAQQDLRAYHGLNAENELVRQAGDEIRREIDREIITDLLAAAATNVNWSKTWPGSGTGYDSKKEYEETLIHAILDADANIHKRRLVRSNWIVTGTDVATRLEKINSFRFNGDLDGGSVVEGPHVFGTLRNRWRVIVDPLFPADKILVGHKGQEFFRTGYVYCPYQGLMVTDRFMDPNDFTPRRGMMRRDAKKTISGDFYSTVSLTA